MSWQLDRTAVVVGRLSWPAQGLWLAKLELATSEAPRGRVTLHLPRIDLAGTIIAAGSSAGRAFARVVGGAGKLGGKTQGQAFTQTDGRTIVQALLKEVGEELDSQSDAEGLAARIAIYAYHAGPAAVALTRLCEVLGCAWWVTPAGKIFVGTQRAPKAKGDWVIADHDPSARCLYAALAIDALAPQITIGHDGAEYSVVAVDHEITPDRWHAQVRY